MRVLLVEDDRELADYIRRGLEEEGYSVAVCFDGASALRTAQSSAFGIILLDVMLPFLDGFEVTRRVRAAHITSPILLLTARDSPQDIVRGLDAGADDHVAKPFSFEVLLARVRARTRPNQTELNSKLRFGDLTLDLDTHEAARGRTRIALTRTEFSILSHLIKSAPRVVPRARLIESVWGTERDVGTNNLEVFMRFLRLKLEVSGHPRLIQTVRGVGYCLREAE